MSGVSIVIVGAFVFADMMVLSGGVASLIVLAALALASEDGEQVKEVGEL
jgi:hypothetical protein